ncbi:Integrase, catalytic core domain protein, partial [mine drainage metagenome]
DCFGGYTDDILYDNMTQVVFERALLTSEHKWNRQFAEFAAYYGLRPRLSWPHRPVTKGKIERTIRFARDNFFLGRISTGLRDLNRQALRWNNTVNAERLHATTGRTPLTPWRKNSLTPRRSTVPSGGCGRDPRGHAWAFGTARKRPKFAPGRCVGRDTQLRLRDHRPLVEVENPEVGPRELRS